MEYAVRDQNGPIKKWKSAEGVSLFDENAIWEPGVVQVVYLKVRNTGTLALEYKLSVNSVGEISGINGYGNIVDLSEYLVVGQVKSATEMTPYATCVEALVAVGTTMGLNDYTEGSKLAVGAEEYVALVVYMPATTSNEVCGPYYEAGKEFYLSLSVIATQADYQS